MASPRLLSLAALVHVATPVVAIAIVFLGSAVVGTCNPTVGDGTPRPPCPVTVVVEPLIRTNEAIAVSLFVAAASWLLANYVILDHLVKSDRQRLVRLAVGIALLSVGLAGIGFLSGLTVRLRYAAEGGLSWGLAGLVLGWFIATVWVGLRPGDVGRRPIRN